MYALRKTTLVAGALYLVTFASIPTLALYRPVHDPNYILGPDTATIVGGILEMIVALAYIGTAVALYPVVKRQNESRRHHPTMFGINERGSAWSALAALPIALWELSLGVYLVVKGFKPSPITSTPRTHQDATGAAFRR